MTNPNLNSRQFDVPIKNFGVDVVSAGEERHLRKFHEEVQHPGGTVRVPISRIRAGQEYVDHDPSGYTRHEDGMPIVGQALPDGRVRLEDGHHRLVEAKLRGDSHLSVQMKSYGPGRCMMPGGCEYGYKGK